MYTISGLVLTVIGCVSFWYLLPRNGQVHPLVQKADGGSMLTIGLMTMVTVGVVLLAAGFLT